MKLGGICVRTYMFSFKICFEVPQLTHGTGHIVVGEEKTDKTAMNKGRGRSRVPSNNANKHHEKYATAPNPLAAAAVLL